MPKQIYYLDEQDIRDLKAVLVAVRDGRLNTANRPAVRPDDITTPEVYVALTPPTGIPPLDETGTGTGTGINEPGSADCQVYRRIVTGGLAELKWAGFSRTVYNLSRTAVPANTYILIERDKWGEWYVTNSADGATCGPAYDYLLDTDANDLLLSDALWWRLYRTPGTSAPQNVNISGVVDSGSGCPLLLTHAGPRCAETGTITVLNESPLSAAVNRILTPAGAPLTLIPGQSVLLRYDRAVGRNRVVTPNVPGVRFIQITDLGQVDGYYPAVEMSYNLRTRSWEFEHECWWLDANQ